MITILIKIFIKTEDILEAKLLLEGNLEGGGGRLQREQERALHLQLGGTSQVTFQFWYGMANLGIPSAWWNISGDFFGAPQFSIFR